MAGLSGLRVLVTGASGLVAFPVAAELAKANEVHALARWSDPEQKRMMEATGARTVTFDLANKDLSSLPDVDVVINYAVLPQQYPQSYEVNTAATGRVSANSRETTWHTPAK